MRGLHPPFPSTSPGVNRDGMLLPADIPRVERRERDDDCFEVTNWCSFGMVWMTVSGKHIGIFGGTGKGRARRLVDRVCLSLNIKWEM